MLSRRDALLLTVLFIASLPAVTARLYSSDEVQYYSYLRSLWFDHDVSFENEYQYFYDHQIAQSADFHRTFLELDTPAHRRINYGTLGCAILWSPFYAVADGIVRVSRMTGAQIEADGYSRPYVSAVAYGSAFYGFATIVLAIVAARQLVGQAALSSGIAIWIGTPLLFYMYVAPPFSHACSAFGAAVFVTIWLRVRGTWSPAGAAALGLAAALMTMVREQDILFTLGPALDFGVTVVSQPRSRRLLVAALAGCVAYALGYLPQLIAYQALNGHPGPSQLVMRKMYWSAPHALQVLGSPEHGFFFWTPLAVLAIAGLVWLTARPESATGESPSRPADQMRRIGVCMLVMVAAQVYVSGAVESWTVAGAFGQRRFVALSMFLVIGLAALRASIRGRGPRLALNTAIVVCVWWNLALIAEFGTSMMDRQRLHLRQNAYDAFVTLPRMAPDLIYRYFSQRSSFYKPPEPAR